MKNNYAIIDSNNVVVNIVVWDGNTDTWSAAPDIAVLIPEFTAVCIGWKYDPQGPNLFVPPDPQNGSVYDPITNTWRDLAQTQALSADPVKVTA